MVVHMSEFKSFKVFQKESHNEAEEIRQDVNETDDFSVSKLEESDIVEQEKDTVDIEHKQSKEIWRNLNNKHYMLGAVSVIFLIFLILLLFPVPFGQMQITGSKVITEEDVMFVGQIKKPINTLQISTADLENRLKHDIRVADVKVSRHLLGIIEVNIVDRSPVAIMQGEYTYVIIDKNGYVLQSDVSIRTADLPMITGKRLGNVLLGDIIKDEDVLKALTFLNALTPEGVDLFSEINIGNPEELKAYTRKGISVHLGAGENLAEQATLAEHMVNDVQSRKLSVEYLEANTSSPFIKLKK